MTYLTAKEIAARLKISVPSAYKLMNKMPHYKDVGGKRVSEQVFNEYLARNAVDNEPQPDILPLPPTVFAGHFAGMQGN